MRFNSAVDDAIAAFNAAIAAFNAAIAAFNAAVDDAIAAVNAAIAAFNAAIAAIIDAAAAMAAAIAAIDPAAAIDATKMCDLQVKIRKILGFVLVVLFIYQYLMGYVERGQWNTYSNGAWEFRATYVCIELRLGSYPFQKFRETPRKFHGITERKHPKTGVIYRYEPWVNFRKPKFYFAGQTTAEKAARIRDVAKFWINMKEQHIKERKGYEPYNFVEEDYNYLNLVQEFDPQQSDNEIKRLVLEHAQPFLKEVQQSQEVPIAYQPPCAEPGRFGSKHITPWPITF